MNKKNKKIILTISFLIVSFLIVKISFAESAATTTTPELPTLPEYKPPKISTEDFFVNFSPENPGANTKVSANIVSYTFDINRASIAWIINGKIVGSGKDFSFATGNLGSVTSLKVSIITPSEEAISKSFVFQAADIDLLWETPGYAPAPYRGKIMPVSKSSVKVTAIPQGIKTSDSKLIYEWRKNDQSVLNSSGQGKKTFSFFSSELGEDVISVKVSTIDESIITKANIVIPVVQPKIIFYEEDPLNGTQYQKSLDNSFSLEKPELLLRAEPYFFSIRALPILARKWQMNGKFIETFEKPNIVNFSKPDQENGTSLIKLSLSNPKNILEMTEKTIRINF